MAPSFSIPSIVPRKVDDWIERRCSHRERCNLLTRSSFCTILSSVSPWTSQIDTAPGVVGVQVMVNTEVVEMPLKSELVKGFGCEPVVCAAATMARAPATRAEKKRIVGDGFV